MSSVNANINITVSSQQAVAQLRALQSQITSLNKGMVASSAGSAAQQSALNKALMDGANASRMWNASVVPMNTAIQNFSAGMDKGTLSLSQYTRSAMSQLPGMSRVFKKEFAVMQGAATENVRRMQTQYVALQRSAGNAQKAMAFAPTALSGQAAQSAIATQKQVLFNRAIDMGSTKLLNWGKNTQWAGRQLMVGMSLPLAMLGAASAKAFKEIDKGSISFKRVYGDLSTTTAEMERNLEAVKQLGKEYTKYGLSLADTIELSSKVAATGATNDTLMAATEETLRLSTLGMMEYGEALDATISLQTAFNVSNEDLGSTIDFLNIVENETILTMQDMAKAIPRVAPVIKGLGGDVQDLAVFMTAMREGGVTAEQGANAIKSGLARLINPTKAAREQLEKYGISIDAIVQGNKGDIMGTVKEFGAALSTLGEFEQQQSLEKVFGKYQYARLGALFKNMASDSSQASRALKLTEMSVGDLAATSERELSKIEEATSTKYAAAMENLKISIAPLGEAFLKALTPIVNFISNIAEKFNNLPDGIKNGIIVVTGLIAGIGPIVLMLIGLIANGAANLIKFVQLMRRGFASIKGGSQAFKHLSIAEQEAMASANSLDGQTKRLTSNLVLQQGAVSSLIGLFERYAGAMTTAAAAPKPGGMMPGAMIPGAVGKSRSIVTGPRTSTVIAGYAEGVTSVPGTGNKDTIPALLTPGESVVTKEATQKYSAVIAAMNAGTLPGFNSGVITEIPRSSTEYAPEGYKYSRGQQGRAGIEKLGERYVQAGGAAADFAAALEAASKKVTSTGKQAAIGMKDIVQNLPTGKEFGLKPGDVPRGPVTSLAAAHLTDSIPFDDPRVRSMIDSSPKGQGKLLGEALFPGTVKGASKLTAGIGTGLNVLLKGEGALPADFAREWGSGKEQLLPAAAAIDPSVLQSQTAVDELKLLADKVRDKAAVVAASAESEKITDSHLAEATRQVIAERQEEVTTLSQSNAQEAAERQRSLNALSTAANEVGEVRQFVPAGDIGKALDDGTLVREGKSYVPNLDNKKVQDAMAAKGINVDEYSALPSSDREVGREKFRPASPIGGRPEVRLTDAQRRSMELAPVTSGKIPDAAKSTTTAANEEFSEGSKKAINANSPAKEGTKAVDMYTEGMEVGVQQNKPEIEKAGFVAGETYDQSVKRAILDGGPIPPLPPGTAPSEVSGSVPEGPKSAAMTQAEEIKKQINDAKSVTVKEKAQISKNLRGISKEVGHMFRTLPQVASEIARNFKESGKIVGSIISQIAAPYTKPIVDAFKFIKDTVVGNVKMAAGLILNDIKKIPTILKGAVDKFTAKVKGSYEMLALRTSVAMDSLKSLPAKVKSAYETAALKTMIALDSIKKLPDTMKRKAKELQNKFNNFKADLPQKIMGARNKAFYNAQDALGRGKQALGGLKERFAGVRERFSASNKYAEQSLREGSLRSAARAYVPDSAAASAKTVSEQITKAATNVKTQLTEAGKNVANSAKLAKILLKDGDTRGAIRAMTPDKIAQAFNAAVKPIANAANVVYGKMVDGAKVIGGKISDAAGTVSRKFNEAAGKITAAGKNLVNSVNVAGRALAARDLKTALRSLTPDKVANALGSAKVRAGEMYGSAKERVTAVASQAKATGITAYNALLAKDVKTFVKALTPDRVWEAGKKLATSISGTAQRVATAGKFAYDTIIFNAKAAIALGPGILKDGFNFVKSSLIQGANFIKDTIAVNVRAALVVGASEIKKAFSIAKTSISQGGKFIYDSVKLNIGQAILAAKTEIYRIGKILATEGPKLRKSLRDAVGGVVGAIKGSGKILADSIKAVGGMVRGAGVAATQGMKGFLQGGVSEKTGQNRGQRIAGAGSGAMMGVMGISMAASMLPGQLGEMSQKIMPVTMGLMGLQMMLPMLTSPIGLLIIAVAAATAAFYKARTDIDNLARKSAKEGSNIGGPANRMEEITRATGYKFANQRVGESMFGFSKKEKESVDSYGQYFQESEEGKKFISELKNATSPERYKKVTALIAQAMADGMPEDQAKDYGKAIGFYANDWMLKSKLLKDFKDGRFESGTQALIDLVSQRQDALDSANLYTRGSDGKTTLNTEGEGPNKLISNVTGMGKNNGATQITQNQVAGAALGAGIGAAAVAGTAVALASTAATATAATLATAGLASALGTATAASLATAAGVAGASSSLAIAGATAGSVVPVFGTIAGAIVGAAVGGFIMWKTTQDQIDKLNKNVKSAAQTWGASLQVLKEVENAEIALNDARRNGNISEEDYVDQLGQIEAVKEKASGAFKSVVDSMMTGQDLDQGAMQQALKDQLVLSGFEGDLAEAVTGTVNFQEIAKNMFPNLDPDEVANNPKFRDQKEIVKQIMIETLAGITPENAESRISNVRETWATIAQDLLAAAENGLTSAEAKGILAGKTAGLALTDALASNVGEDKIGTAANMSQVDLAAEYAKATKDKKVPAGEVVTSPSGIEFKSREQSAPGEAKVGGLEDILINLDKDLKRPSSRSVSGGTSIDDAKGLTKNQLFGGGFNNDGKEDYAFTSEDREGLMALAQATGKDANELFIAAFMDDPIRATELIKLEDSDLEQVAVALNVPVESVKLKLQELQGVAQAKIDNPFEVLGTKADKAGEAWDSYVTKLETAGDFKKMKTSAEEVSAAMAELGASDIDPKIIGSITKSEDAMNQFTETVAVLASDKYKNIPIDVGVKYQYDNNKTPEDMIKEVDEVYKASEKRGKAEAKKGKKQKKEFDKLETATGGPDAAANLWLSASKEVKDGWTKVAQASGEGLYTEITNKAEKAVDDLAKLADDKGRVKITSEVVTSLFGENVADPDMILANLNAAFGNKKIDPSFAAVIAELKFSNPDAWAAFAAISGNTAAMDAIKGGGKEGDSYNTGEYTDNGRGQMIPQTAILTANDVAVANVVSAGKASTTFKNTGKDPDPKGGGSSSGGKEKETPLKDLNDELNASLFTYTNIQKIAEKNKKAKDKFNKTMMETGYGGSIVAKLRRQGLSEKLVADILAKGVGFAKRILKDTKTMRDLNKKTTIAMAGEQISDLEQQKIENNARVKAAPRLKKAGLDPEYISEILSDPAVAQTIAGLKVGSTMWGNYIKRLKSAKVAADAAEDSLSGVSSALQKIQDKQEAWGIEAEKQNAFFDREFANIEMALNIEFKSNTGKTVADIEKEVKANEKLIKGYEKNIQTLNDEISVIERKRGISSDYSDWGSEQIQEEIDKTNKLIAAKERENEIAQRKIDNIRREDEMRTRVSDAISHDLEIMSDQEQKITESYNKRIEALDKVSSINERIANQQKEQLNLSKAISEGDIYAAASAAQDMRADSASFATQQLRSGLETAMENQIKGLKTSDGSTREEAEKRIKDIQEQSYQTSLRIRDLDDAIYNRQMNEILPLKDQEYNLGLAQEKVQALIEAKQLSIRDIERSKIDPLTRQNELMQTQVDDLLSKIEEKQLDVKNAAEQTKDEFEAINNWQVANLAYSEAMEKGTEAEAEMAKQLAAQWKNVGDQIKRANDALKGEYNRINLIPITKKYTKEQREADRKKAETERNNAVASAFSGVPKPSAAVDLSNMDFSGIDFSGLANIGPFFNAGGEVSKYARGGVAGNGSRDSVLSMLTPGEFVIRKSMVDKYGKPMFDSINQGAFSVPRYSTPQEKNISVMNAPVSVNNVSAPVYNTYDMKLSISGANQSADEIANKVMFKIQQAQAQGIRGNRGY